jgi:peptidyl-dipeptidase Dcp
MITKKNILMAAVAIAACGCSPQKSDNRLFNEFTAPHGIAPFSEITIENYREGMLRGMEEQRAEIEAITNNTEEPTFENTIMALDQCGELMRKVRGTFSPLSSSNSTDETRALEKELSPLFSAHNDDIYLNETLFARVKKVYDSRASLTLTAEQKKVMENIYKRFVNSGAELNQEQKAKLRA